MGCCLTTTATAAATTDANKIQPKTRDTSPPGSGEETVKEVLSETPIISNKPGLQSNQEFRSKIDFVQATKNSVNENASEVSSEIYTYSAASLSTVTTTTIGTGVEVDDDGEVTQKVNHHPPVKMVSKRPPVTSSGERARRKEGGGRTRRELTSRTVTANPRRRNVLSANVVGREPPVRRPRSPAVRGEVGQVRKVKEKNPVENSGKRVPKKAREDEEHVKLKVKVKVPEPELEREIRDMLDNPRVSLECFIFL